MQTVRTTKKSGLIAALTFLLSACGTGNSTTVVLLDRSGSIGPEDLTIYAQSLENLSKELQPGDRVLVAPIGDTDRSRFIPLYDATVPTNDMRLVQEKEVLNARQQFEAQIGYLLAKEAYAPASSTRILEAVAAASEAFGSDPHDGDRLIILSDAVEESPTVNMATMRQGDGYYSEELQAARDEGLLPNLAGVRIHFVGAGGDGTEIGVSGVRDFWLAFARETGASIKQSGRLPYRNVVQ